MRGITEFIILTVSVGSLCFDILRNGKCVDSLMKIMDPEMGECDELQSFVKCYIQEEKLDLVLTTTYLIQLGQNKLNSFKSQIGVNCDVKLTNILRDIRQEKRMVTQATRRPTEFQDASTSEECMNVLGRTLKDEGITCKVASSYVKCIIRVRGLYKSTLKADNLEFETSVRAQMGLVGLSCGFSMRDFIEEVAREQNKRDHRPTVAPAARTAAALTSTTARAPGSVTKRVHITTTSRAQATTVRPEATKTARIQTITENRASSARGIPAAADCLKNASVKSGDVCSAWRSRVKCMIQAKGFDRLQPGGSVYDELQSEYDDAKKEHGQKCVEDLSVLIQEAHQEQTQRHESHREHDVDKGKSDSRNRGTNGREMFSIFLILTAFPVLMCQRRC